MGHIDCSESLGGGTNRNEGGQTKVPFNGTEQFTCSKIGHTLKDMPNSIWGQRSADNGHHMTTFNIQHPVLAEKAIQAYLGVKLPLERLSLSMVQNHCRNSEIIDVRGWYPDFDDLICDLDVKNNYRDRLPPL